MTREEITKLLDEMDHVGGPLMQDAIAGVRAATNPESLAREIEHVTAISQRAMGLMARICFGVQERHINQQHVTNDQLDGIPGALLAYCKSLGESNKRDYPMDMTNGSVIRIPNS